MSAAEEGPAADAPPFPKALTLEDVAALAEADEFHRYELQEGGLIVLPPPDLEHAKILTRLTAFLLERWPVQRVVQAVGVRIGDDTGRIPDLVVTRRELTEGVWIDPAELLLVVEVVSPSTRASDRLVKPGEYARSGVLAYWRVERDGGPPTVHMYTLGVGEHGEPAYVEHRAELLEHLLAGDPPDLGK